MSSLGRPPTRFGLFIGQTDVAWSELVERTLLAEELGFDHVWLVDHLMPTEPPVDRPIFEAWTSLAALATLTNRIHIGILVSSNTFRHPAILAKQATTVDHASAGRLILGIGTGWYAAEHQRFGLEFPGSGERVDRLSEALNVLELLQTGRRVTHDGRYYQLQDAQALPVPIQRPRIPMLIAAHRPRMLRIAARHADMWDTFVTTHGTATAGVTTNLQERTAIFDAACRTKGRDPMTVRRSTWVGGEALENEEAYEAFVAHHRALGFTDLLCGLPAREAWDVARRVAADLLPAVREEEAAAARVSALGQTAAVG